MPSFQSRALPTDHARAAEEKLSITAEIARELLRYEPETGKLYWRERGPEWFEDSKCSAELACKRWNAARAGKEAGSLNSKGYSVVAIFRYSYLAHRVIWLMVYGEWPTGQIDHIDQDKANNCIENLRDVTCAENNRNKPRQLRNKSGVTGVSWAKKDNRWQALITVDGKQKHLGHFKNQSDAIAARKAAEKKYGFHQNHGRAA